MHHSIGKDFAEFRPGDRVVFDGEWTGTVIGKVGDTGQFVKFDDPDQSLVHCHSTRLRYQADFNPIRVMRENLGPTTSVVLHAHRADDCTM